MKKQWSAVLFAAMLLTGCSESSSGSGTESSTAESSVSQADTAPAMVVSVTDDTFNKEYADCVRKYFEAIDKEDYEAYEAQVYPPYQEAYDAFLKSKGNADLHSAFADMHAQFDEDGYESWHFSQLDLDYCENEDIDDFFDAYISAGIYDEAFVEACRKDAKELRDIQFTLYALYEGDAEAIPVVQNGEIIVIQTNDDKYYLFG